MRVLVAAISLSIAATCTPLRVFAAVEDYVFPYQTAIQQILRLNDDYISATARLLSGRPQVDTQLVGCFVQQSGSLAQVALVLQNLVGLSTATRIVTNPGEKASIRQLANNTLLVAQKSVASSLSLFRTPGAISGCQDGQLAELNQQAAAILADIDNGLGQVHH